MARAQRPSDDCLTSTASARYLACLGAFMIVAQVWGGQLVDGENAALNRPYQWNRPPNYGLSRPDLCHDDADATQLTNGLLSTRQWWDKQMVGWEGSTQVDLTVDLGEVCPIAAIAYHVAGGWYAGVRYPERHHLYVSEDGESFHQVGEWWIHTHAHEFKYEPYHTFTFTDLRALGRYVKILLDPGGRYLMMDEIEVIRGDFTPEQAQQYPLVEHPWTEDVSVLESAHVAPRWATPLHFYSPGRWGKPPYRLDLPAGIRVVAAPLGIPEPQQVQLDGRPYSRYNFTENLSYLFLKTDWPVGKQGTLYLTIADKYVADLPVTCVDIPAAPRPKRLLTNFDWTPLEYYLNWPDFLDFWEHIGFNTIALHKDATLDPSPQAQRFIQQARARGFWIVANYSPMFADYKADSEAHPEVQRAQNPPGQDFTAMCPRLYVRDYFDDEVEVCRQTGALGISWMWFDYEPGWGGSGSICFCPHCRAQFREFLAAEYPDTQYLDPVEVENDPGKYPRLHQAWRSFNAALGREIVRRLRQGLMEGLATTEVRSSPQPMVGLYNVWPRPQEQSGGFYNHFMLFESLFDAGLVEQAMPSLYGCYRDQVAATIHACREVVGTGSVMPWHGITSGRAEWRNTLLETFANGGTGFTYFTTAYVDAADYAAAASIIKAAAQVEDIICDGQLIPQGRVLVRVSSGGEAAGLILGDRLLVLVKDYARGAPVQVEVARVEKPATVTDLETGQAVARLQPPADSFAAQLTTDRRSVLLLIAPQ